ncbi:MAG TPA: hypothetical protein ENH85_06710 [Candidatus Scalindua sp.]|nr:hypothetical protein [Candidatus Scalindua sp.]
MGYTSEEFKKKALSSLYWFDRYVLGFNSATHPDKRGMEEKPHREMCNFVQDWSSGKKKKLLCVPRKSLKTSCITVGYSLFELAHDPSMTVLIDSVERAIAATFLEQIRSITESNEAFRGAFGDWVNKRGWGSHEITIKDKPSSMIKEPSIGTAGVDSSKVAFHPKLMILDDLVNRDTVKTPQALMKTIRHYQDLMPMLGEDGRIVMVATRWDVDDLIAYILENEPDEWDIFIRSGINDDGTPYYPEMLSLKWIQEQLDKDPYFASCQYLCDPVNPSATMFNRDDIEWYEENKELPNQRTNYMTVDPAGHEGSVGDNTAIMYAGVDKTQNIYVYEPDFDRFNLDAIVSAIFTKYLSLKIRRVGIEQNYFRGALASAVTRRGQEWGTKPRIEPLKHYGRTERKEDRIGALQPWFADGKIFLKGKKIKIGDKEQWVPVGKNMKKLYQQIISYPRAKMSDDLIDALAMMLEIIRPSGGLDPLAVKVAKPVDKVFGY